MGCDIHMGVEVRRNGVWTAHGASVRDVYGEGSDMVFWKEPYQGRSYNLFAILADVRNGSGFAGVKTGEGFIPISPPKGVPPDASSEFKRWCGEWSGDAHSHSYHTVADLMAYDWTQTTGLQGYVPLSKIQSFLYSGEPKEWFGMVSGPGIVYEDAERVRAIWKSQGQKRLWDGEVIAQICTALGHPDPGRVEVLCKWTVPYHHPCQEFLGETLPKLWRLGEPENVRIVFFFDN